MQHAGLKDSCTADILTVEFLVRLVDWFFPDFNYTWLVEEIKNTTPKVCKHIPALPVQMQNHAAHCGMHCLTLADVKQEERPFTICSCRNWTSQ